MKYYDIKRIKKEKAAYNIIFGGRSNGKSTAICKMLIDNFKENGSQFGRILRYITDCNSLEMEGWFSSDYLAAYVAEKWGQKICFYGSKWYFVDLDEEDPYSKKAEKEYFGRIFFLNTEFRYKSAQYPEIKKLVMEEFVLMDVAQYMPQEFPHFLSLVSTVNRSRSDLSVWFLGNTLNKANPYFSGLGINIEKLKMRSGDLRIMRNRYGVKIAIEYAEMSYDNFEEVPDVLKVEGNEIAFEGDFSEDPNVYNLSELNRFLKRADPVYAATLVYKDHKWILYKVKVTPKQIGWAVLPGEYFKSDEILINLNNRLIDIDQQRGKTIGHLKEIGFDLRLCLCCDEDIKYTLSMAMRAYS